MNWKSYFPGTPLRHIPSFDARIVLYPGIREVRDYFSWRQADSVLRLSRERGPAIDHSYQPTLTTYTIPPSGLLFNMEGNQKKTPTSLFVYALRCRFFIIHIQSLWHRIGHEFRSETRDTVLEIRYKLQRSA
jgi:hypothetical protein